MKRNALTFTLIIAILTLTILSTLTIKNVKAENDDYKIEKVYHSIEIMYNGYIFINDTIQIDGKAPNGFLMGFQNLFSLSFSFPICLFLLHE